MHSRRSHGDSKSTSSISDSVPTMSTTNNNPSTSTTGRVSIYSMRERVIINKMIKIMGKLAPDTESEVTSRLHQEIPAVGVNGLLTHCLYTALQNLIHLNAIYILLYHGVFWLSSHSLIPISSQILEKTEYEETHFITLPYDDRSTTRKSINTDLINKYVYVTLIGISTLELINAFLWTIRKKLPYLMKRKENLRDYLSKCLIGMMIIVNLSFLTWLLFHTFITQQLTLIFFFLIISHLIALTILDKPNLFQVLSYNLSKQSATTGRHALNSISPSQTSPMTTKTVGRSSTSMSSRKSKLSVSSSSSAAASSLSSSPSIVNSWSRWSSVTEEKIERHECSMLYARVRQEADELWRSVIRRIILSFYRTFSSLILFDLIPIKMLDTHACSTDSQPLKMLLFIFSLSTFVTHSAFLFPMKLQTTVHRVATHLGQWRQQSKNIRTNTINEWSPECNSYTHGSVVKLSSNKQCFIAMERLSNAANPLSESHSILYRLFGDPTYFLTVQFFLCIVLVIFHIIWIIRGTHWEQIIIGYLIILHSSYPIFKIVRDRIIMKMVEEHEFFQTSTVSKQKKLN